AQQPDHRSMPEMYAIEVADGERDRRNRTHREGTQDMHSLPGYVVGGEEDRSRPAAGALRERIPATPSRSHQTVIVAGRGGRGPRASGAKRSRSAGAALIKRA